MALAHPTHRSGDLLTQCSGCPHATHVRLRVVYEGTASERARAIAAGDWGRNTVARNHGAISGPEARNRAPTHELNDVLRLLVSIMKGAERPRPLSCLLGVVTQCRRGTPAPALTLGRGQLYSKTLERNPRRS